MCIVSENTNITLSLKDNHELFYLFENVTNFQWTIAKTYLEQYLNVVWL